MNTFLIKYRLQKILRSFQKGGILVSLIAMGSAGWVIFLLSNNILYASREISAQINQEVSPLIIQKNVEVNALAGQIAEQQIASMFSDLEAFIDQHDIRQLIASGRTDDALMELGKLKQKAHMGVSDVVIRSVAFSEAPQYLSGIDINAEGTFVVFALGTIEVHVNTNIFSDWLSKVRPGTDVFTFIIDREGRLVSGSGVLSKDTIMDFSEDHDVKLAVDNKISSEIFSINEDKILSSFRPIGDYGWSIVTRLKI